MQRTGIVYLVGAGPGDYELITLKAIRLIQAADTIIYDRLADDRLLDYKKSDAELIYVGKASSRHTMRQEDINKLLVLKAKQGKRVVRLKGGDPFVFGRGGEEALELFEHNIPFEIVPGITSAISVPAYAGIPVTHRNIAASFTVVTGHEAPEKEQSSINWSNLATGADTLVFLMGIENIEHISKRLIENGRDENTPVAVIRWGTKPEQKVLQTMLKNAARDVQAAGMKPPAIFIVGEVVNLRDKLAWFDTRPLFGKNILVTRARAQAGLLTQELENLGAKCIEAPSIKIVPPTNFEKLDSAIKKLPDYNWVIFTSVNGVEHFFIRLYQTGFDARALSNAKIAAIGTQTALKLSEHGIKADLVPIQFQAEGLIEILAKKVVAGSKILIPRALVARDILPEKLAEMGAEVDVVPAYETVQGDADKEQLVEKLKNNEIDIVTFTSSSTVLNLVKLLGEEKHLLRDVTIACIGPITADTCRKNGINPDIIANEFTIKGLTKAIEHYFREV